MPESGQADGDQVPACGGNARLNQATFPDFVVARTNEDNIQIGLGNGSGGIAKNYTYSMGNGPATCAGAWPEPLVPQQATSPPVSTAQAKLLPTLTDVKAPATVSGLR